MDDLLNHDEPSQLSLQGRLRDARRGVALNLTLVAVLALVVALVASYVVAQSPHSAPLTPVTTLAARSPQTLGTGAWQSVALPGKYTQAVYPSPGDPSTLYACTASSPTQMDADVPLTVWLTSDAGQHWRSAALPRLTGVGCELSVARDAPQRVLLTVIKATTNAHLICNNRELFLSTDGGASWQALPSFTTTYTQQEVFCDFWATAHHLFVIYSYANPGNANLFQINHFARSDDEGLHWQSADSGLIPNTIFIPTQMGNEDTMLANIFDHATHTYVLFQTRDAGNTWTRLGTSDGDTFVLTAAGPGGPDADHPIYTLQGEQADYIRIFESFDSHNWTRLPELPIPGDTYASTPNISEIAALLPDGRLAVLGNNPHAAQTPTDTDPKSPHYAQKQQWLWIWQPRMSRWSYVEAPLWLSNLGCGLCWAHFSSAGTNSQGKSGTYIWIWDHDAHPDVIYRMFIAEV